MDDNFAYRANRTGCHKMLLSLYDLKENDTLSALIEVTNTGKYDYHPIVWHMVDTFIYAVEMRKLDDLFVTAFLIRYTIPKRQSKGELIDISKIKQSMRILYYVQVLDKYFFEISDRKPKIEKPVYFDLIIDQKGVITIAILEKDKKKMTIYSKSIEQHEKESVDSIPIYRRIDTWNMIDSFSASIQDPFRIFKENNKFYILTERNNVFEVKNKNIEQIKIKVSEPIILLFNKNAKKPLNFMTINNFNKMRTINKTGLRQITQKLIGR